MEGNFYSHHHHSLELAEREGSEFPALCDLDLCLVPVSDWAMGLWLFPDEALWLAAQVPAEDWA